MQGRVRGREAGLRANGQPRWTETMTDGSEYSIPFDGPEEETAAQPGAAAAGAGHEEMLVRRLADAVRRADTGAQRAALAAMQASGAGSEAISEHYIPEAARLLGEEWCSDSLSFADVTIGTARLQAILRDLEAKTARGGITDGTAPTVLVVVPPDEYHTLGAMVVTGQLRRMGSSVRLCAGQELGVLLEFVASGGFDMILVSWANSERLDALQRLVARMRKAAPAPTPIVVGGAILSSLEDTAGLTGADFATSDVAEALDLCGLSDRVTRAGRCTAMA